jgi:hypothetical protein
MSSNQFRAVLKKFSPSIQASRAFRLFAKKIAKALDSQNVDRKALELEHSSA